MILMNDQMKRIISCFNIEDIPQYSNPNLIDLINPVFVEIDGFILRLQPKEKVKSLKTDLIINSFGDRTGFEAFDSHIHVIDYIDEFRYGLFEGFRFFLQLTHLWGNELMKLFPYYKFHVVLAYDDKDCNLRFYRLRNDESSWIDIEGLNDYKDEAILVKTIGLDM